MLLDYWWIMLCVVRGKNLHMPFSAWKIVPNDNLTGIFSCLTASCDLSYTPCILIHNGRTYIKQHTTRDQRPPRHRTHQEPRARSYRRQVAARSSDRPTEYSRARDSYDSGKTYYGDDADNTYARNNRSGAERRRHSYRPYCSYNSY